jgi:hypothetical protein
MKRISFLMLLCIFGTLLSAGCIGFKQDPVQRMTIVVSNDPTACKSIKIDCSIHNSGGVY